MPVRLDSEVQSARRQAHAGLAVSETREAAAPMGSDGPAGADYRAALAHYPTGVSIVASKVPDIGPVGMVIGTFTSVSLDPPLVGFLPSKGSSTWPLLREVGRFSINVLDIHHDRVCRDFASRSPNRFDPRVWDTTDMPRLSGAVLWVDSTLESVTDAGDHDFVLARIHNLEVCRGGSPMVFVRGGYGSPHLPHEIRRAAWSRLHESTWVSDPWD